MTVLLSVPINHIEMEQITTKIKHPITKTGKQWYKRYIPKENKSDVKGKHSNPTENDVNYLTAAREKKPYSSRGKNCWLSRNAIFPDLFKVLAWLVESIYISN